MNDFLYGLRKGLPIGLGYFAVSFSFGVAAVSAGITPLASIIISATNLSSAGQLAGIKLIVANAAYFEIFLTVLLINIRYALMSISLSQKISPDMPLWQRAIVGYGITDEIYALSITEVRSVTFKYMLGLILLPVVGWVGGTTAGVFLTDLMPQKLINAMGIALYAMFIAIIVPDAKKNYKILSVILIAIAISCLLYYTPYIKNIGLGFKIIISTTLASLFGTFVFPLKPLDDIKEDDNKEASE